MIRNVCLDIDGVLNKFHEHALRHLGCTTTGHDPKWGWDIVRSCNEQHPTRRFTASEFWDSITHDVWSTAPLSDECPLILQFAEDLVGRGNVCLLTSPTRDPQSLAGKLVWIQRFMPTWLHRKYLVGPCKWFCARPDTLLIDDADHNVEEFREAGGQGILVPRPWNTHHNLDTRRFLHAQFRLLCGEKAKRESVLPL
jgi:hypothetical protein